MQPRARAVLTTVLVTAAAVTFVTAAVGAQTPEPAATPLRGRSEAAHAARPAPQPLPPVSEHPLPPHVSSGASGSAAESTAGPLVQVIQVQVHGGGLTLATNQVTVTLERAPGSHRDWVGTLPAVEVIDARGTHSGWRLRWSAATLELTDSPKAAHVPLSKVHLEPGTPIVVAGERAGVVAGKPGPAVHPGRLLMEAAPGFGGGTYAIAGTISVRLPTSVEAERVSVTLSFTLD